MTKAITDAELFERLAEVQQAYEGSLGVAALAASTHARMYQQEPVRNIYYPLDLTVNGDAVNALVE